MEGLIEVVVFMLVALAVIGILVLGGVGAASGYVAGRRAPSSTGRSGAIAGLAIGGAVGTVDVLVMFFTLETEGLWLPLLLLGALVTVVGTTLFAYRGDLRTPRTIWKVVGVAVLAAVVGVVVLAALVGIWLE